MMANDFPRPETIKSDKDSYKNIHTRLREKVSKRILRLNAPSSNNRIALEWGVGLGGNLPVIASFFDTIEAYDLSPEAIAYCQEHYPLAHVRYFCNDAGSCENKGHFDAIFMYSILEHLQNDRLMLRKAAQLLKAGGLLFMQVPQCKSYFSVIDEFYGHFRRYDSEELKEMLKFEGLEIMEFRSLGIGALWGFEIAKFKRKYGPSQFKREDQNLISSYTEFSRTKKALYWAKWPFMKLLERPYDWFSKRFALGVELFVAARKGEASQSEKQEPL